MSSSPQFAAIPRVGWVTLTAANNVYDGTGTQGALFVAGSSGSLVNFIKCKAMGTNVASLLRVYLNNGASNAVASNNVLIAESALSATTASTSAALQEVVIPLSVAVPAGYTLLVSLSTAVAAGWAVSAFGADV